MYVSFQTLETSPTKERNPRGPAPTEQFRASLTTTACQQNRRNLASWHSPQETDHIADWHYADDQIPCALKRFPNNKLESGWLHLYGRTPGANRAGPVIFLYTAMPTAGGPSGVPRTVPASRGNSSPRGSREILGAVWMGIAGRLNGAVDSCRGVVAARGATSLVRSSRPTSLRREEREKRAQPHDSNQ